MMKYWLLAADWWLIAAPKGLTFEEQQKVEFLLAIITGLLLLLVVGLLSLAVAVRYIARNSTHPCRWCMEFISKKEAVCPRCGKPVAPAAEPAKPRT